MDRRLTFDYDHIKWAEKETSNGHCIPTEKRGGHRQGRGIRATMMDDVEGLS